MLIQPATPPASGSQIDGEPIRSGSFWPELDPVATRAAMRLDGTVTAERLRGALIEAIASVNSQLAEWRRSQLTAGYASLADVLADEIDGQSIQVQRWQRAVQCLAAANLTERYRSFDSTAAGHKQADELDTTVDDLRRDGRWAICDIVGRGRSTIELI
ncbi:head completion/stabilization protein [Chromobacterium alkanivorans]|uniref:head completion/stabilization protein n=1 Tax=Chromobacterium alkanivorans TaxID=1071719 RepID=UPI001966D1C3|nr:head completion/stabilization protein [Chromobacterium alkanivorans]MBN3005571.1 head completion/stabilization protein [Chromobacterium alkanivorans]